MNAPKIELTLPDLWFQRPRKAIAAWLHRRAIAKYKRAVARAEAAKFARYLALLERTGQLKSVGFD